MTQLDTDFVETLHKGLGDFKTTLKENIENVKPRGQYIVLVAGKLTLHINYKLLHKNADKRINSFNYTLSGTYVDPVYDGLT